MIEAWAAKYVGLPFRWGGRDRNGVDCYGLVCLVYKEQFHVLLPNLEEEDIENILDPQSRAEIVARERGRWKCVPANQVSRGNVLLLRLSRLPAHVGIYVGNGRMLHADQRGNACIEPLDSPIWRDRIECACVWEEGK